MSTEIPGNMPTLVFPPVSEFKSHPYTRKDDIKLLDTLAAEQKAEGEYTGGSVDYYKVKVTCPTSGGDSYMAECNDVIEALGMNYAEGNAFKAIWRSCAARTLGKKKKGSANSVYDAEKVIFFGQRMLAQANVAMYKQGKELEANPNKS